MYKDFFFVMYCVRHAHGNDWVRSFENAEEEEDGQSSTNIAVIISCVFLNEMKHLEQTSGRSSGPAISRSSEVGG